jgi:hypothetical protein
MAEEQIRRLAVQLRGKQYAASVILERLAQKNYEHNGPKLWKTAKLWKITSRQATEKQAGVLGPPR